jgi:hypothetical protein
LGYYFLPRDLLGGEKGGRKGKALVSTRKLTTIALVVLVGLSVLGSAASASVNRSRLNSVTLDYVEAIPGLCQVEIRWATLSEVDTAGFNVMRGRSSHGPWEQANENLIIAIGDNLNGAEYSFVDADLASGITYYYHIQELTNTSVENDYMGHIALAKPPALFLPFTILP